ncbi:MAG: glycerophosphodiester phosphodiesterase [Bacillaceae bacterium]|nr:glycerophosphodiester phosphodiesterase [Bacillaceae bacterium]
MNVCMAHRGWSGRAPENTMAAIKMALEEPHVRGIEIDVHLSQDGVPVVIHDFTLDRTTNGKGYVGDHPFEELSCLDAGGWFSPEFTGEKILSLQEVLEVVRGKTRLNIELKQAGQLYPGLEEKVVEMIDRYNMQSDVYVTSFDHESVKKVKLLNPDLTTGLIIMGKPVLVHEQLEETGATVLSMAYSYLTKTFLQEMYENGMVVIAWTVDDQEHIRSTLNLHPDIQLCTNFPERVIPYL